MKRDEGGFKGGIDLFGLQTAGKKGFLQGNFSKIYIIFIDFPSRQPENSKLFLNPSTKPSKQQIKSQKGNNSQ